MRRFSLTLLLFLACVPGCKKDEVTGGQNVPTISNVNPQKVFAGQQSINGRIRGTNYTGIVAVDLGPGIEIESTRIIDSTRIAVRFSVQPDAAPGSRVVRVTTLAGIATNGAALQVEDNRTPSANFTFTPEDGGIGTPFVFDASESSDPDGSISSYDWDFGDGQTATGATAEHSFASGNSFKVTLTVTDDRNGKGTAQKDLIVKGTRPPVAHFTAVPPRGDVNTQFLFDATASTDDNRVAGYRWDFGDGTSGQGKQVRHRFSRSGDFPVTLTINDANGLLDSTSREIEVLGKPPIADFLVNPPSGFLGTTFEFDSSLSSDPDGTIVDHAWELGDGTVKKGPAIQHKYSKEGGFEVKLTVTDDSGLTGFASQLLQVGKDDLKGAVCTTPVSKRSPDWYGRILHVDKVRGIYDIKLHTQQTCATAYYWCGDVKRFVPGGEDWFGTICKMVYLGNSTFRLYVVRNKKYPEVGMDDVYIHWQTCDLPWCD